VVRVQAKDALVRLGWKASIATSAVDTAIRKLGDPPLEHVLRTALQQCWKPEVFAPQAANG
jgi:hypothetical protein